MSVHWQLEKRAKYYSVQVALEHTGTQQGRQSVLNANENSKKNSDGCDRLGVRTNAGQPRVHRFAENQPELYSLVLQVQSGKA